MPLDAYEAYSDVDLRDTMPKFARATTTMKAKADAVSRRSGKLAQKTPAFRFQGSGRRRQGGRGQAGEVRRRQSLCLHHSHGPRAGRHCADHKHFYYKVPDVLRALEGFLATQPELAKVIWLERGDNFFMFVLQRKK